MSATAPSTVAQCASCSRYVVRLKSAIDTSRNVLVLLGGIRGANMNAVGIVDIEIENPARSGERRTLRAVLVDTGAGVVLGTG